MKKLFVLVALFLTSCSSAPAVNNLPPNPVYPNASGSWKGQVIYSKCYPGSKSDLKLTFANKSGSTTSYIGNMETSAGIIALEGVYNITDKNFFFIPTIQSSASFTLTISDDLKLMVGIFKQPFVSSCADGSKDAEASVSVTKI